MAAEVAASPAVAAGVGAALITLEANNPANLGNEGLASAVGALRSQIPPALLTAIATHNTAMTAASANQPKPNLTTAFPGFPDIQHAENYLLPIAFPEGSPTHPAYGAGHATVAGACVTVLKAFFEMFEADGVTERAWPWEAFVPNFPSSNQNEGGELEPAADQTGYTVKGELDKLAMNIANARNMAGVHYYTDYYESVRLGERIAVSILEEQLSMYDEPLSMSFTTFDGEPIRIVSNGGTARVIVDGTTAENWYGRHSS